MECLLKFCIKVSYMEVKNTGHPFKRVFFYPFVIETIEGIQFFLLNMAFISSSEVENIYIS